MAKKRRKRTKVRGTSGTQPLLAGDIGTVERMAASCVTVETRTADGIVRTTSVNGIAIRDRTVTESGFVAGQGAVNQLESPLDLLLNTGLLDGTDGRETGEHRHRAGLKLRETYLDGAMQPRMTGSYSRGGYGGTDEKTDDQALAEMRYLRAARFLGPLADVAQSVCCHDRTPRPRDMLRLLQALDLLCDYWGIGPARRS